MNWLIFKSKAVEYETAVLSSLSIYFDAHKFVRKNNFIKYLFVSGIAFLLLFTITIKSIIYGVSYIEGPITHWLLPWK